MLPINILVYYIKIRKIVSKFIVYLYQFVFIIVNNNNNFKCRISIHILVYL